MKVAVATTCCTDKRCEVCAGTNHTVKLVNKSDPQREAHLAAIRLGAERTRGSRDPGAPLEPQEIEKLRVAWEEKGSFRLSRIIGTAQATVKKALAGEPLRSDSLERLRRWLAA